MPDWSGIAQGIAEGAVSGGTAGAAFGPWGIPIGAGLAAIGMGTARGLANRDQPQVSPQQNGQRNAFGTSGKYNQLPQYSAQQQNIMNQTGQMGLENMKNPYAGFEPLQQAATDYYHQQLVPETVNRFNASSGGARLTSPNFASQLASAGTGLSAMLNQQRMQYGQANKQFGLAQAQFGASPQFENIYEGGKEGWAKGLADDISKLGASSFDDVKALMSKYFDNKKNAKSKKAYETFNGWPEDKQKKFIQYVRQLGQQQAQQNKNQSQFNMAPMRQPNPLQQQATLNPQQHQYVPGLPIYNNQTQQAPNYNATQTSFYNPLRRFQGQ